MATPDVQFRYEGDDHKKLLNAIQSRVRMSKNSLRNRLTKWNHADELYRAYVNPTEEDRVRKDDRETKGKPQFVTINVPYSYAILLTAHTYWSSVFLARTPILQYTARHGQPEMSTQAVEAIMDYQVNVGGMLPVMYGWLLDAGKYGVGVVGNYWCEEKSAVTEMVEQQQTFLGVPIPGKTRIVKQRSFLKGYVGNKLFSVRPQDFLPDPRVPLQRFQDGEFCGRVVNVGWNTIMRGKADGKYFNIASLQAAKARAANEREPAKPSDLDLPDVDAQLTTTLDARDYGSCELIEMCVELIPTAWNLGNSTYPEKWVFTLADNSVIIGANPLGSYHDKFPFDILLYEVDPYSISPRGLMEITEPLNETMNWLFNTHFYNVRKVLNGVVVVDPSRVVMNDLKEGGPGGIWRLKPTAYGSDVRTVVSQQAVTDVTRTNLQDAQIVAELLQRVSGVSDNVMGMLGVGGRKTATEVRTSSSFGVNRLKTSSEFFSATGWSPLSQKLLQNTQQNFDEEMTFRVAGDLLRGVQYLKVDPRMIAGFFDFVPVDGTMPIDRFAQANLWKDILMGMGRMPQLTQQYDIGGIFAWMAQLGGLKNINQFKINIVPDGAAAAGVQAGNLVPMGGMPGGAPPNPTMPADAGRMPGASNAGAAGPVA